MINRRFLRRLGLLGLLLGLLPAVVWAQLDRYYYYRTSLKFMARGQYTSAISTINVFLSFLPDDYRGLYIRAWAKYNLEDFRGTLADLDKTVEHNPFMVEALLLRGATLNQLNAPAKAKIDLELAHEMRPNDRTILNMRGITYLLLKEYALASADFIATLQHSPHLLDTRINLGVSQLMQGDTVSAIATFEQATVSNPYSPAPYVYLARIEYSRSRCEEAMASLDEALRIDPGYASALLVKALVLHEQEKRDEALELLSKVIALSPRNSMALYNRAIILGENKQYRAALRDYESAQEISPSNVFIRYNAGLMYAQLKQPKRAIESMSAAIALFPQFARAYTMRGHLRLESGDRKGAKADLDTAQSLMQRYEQGTLDKWSDTSAQFSRLMAFENDFSSKGEVVMASAPRVVELLPIATVSLGAVQPHKEWHPVLRADSVCGAPIFSLVVPREDSTMRVDVSLFPPIQNAHALRIARAKTLYDTHEYDEAIKLLGEVPASSLFHPLATYMRAVCLVDRVRYASVTPVTLGQTEPTHDAKPDYNEPLRILGKLKSTYPNAYLDYSEGIAHFLSKNLEKAEASFDAAIAQQPQFGEAYYNRALVRLLKNAADDACLDLSRAGELGIDDAYRVISMHCKR